MPYHIFDSTSTGKLDFMKKSLALGPKKKTTKSKSTILIKLTSSVRFTIVRDLEIKVFQHFLQGIKMSRTHVISACHQVCSLRFTFVGLDHALVVSDVSQGFFAL